MLDQSITIFATMNKKLKIGILGAGHLGKIHIKLLKEISAFEICGFYDPNEEVATQVSRDFDIPFVEDSGKLISQVDAVDIVTPTLSHFECAVMALKNGKHIFIEKPMTNTPDEAKKLIELVEEAAVKVQIGHVERFNPAFLAVKDKIGMPLFIESHRLASFNPRGSDVSVILDLMVHDIDLILSIVNASIRSISASGVAIISNSPDIANARIEFDNGCVANLTASRISVKQMRKMRIFQQNAYISIDFLDKQAQMFSLFEQQNEAGSRFPIYAGAEFKDKYVEMEETAVKNTNAIKNELELFASSILSNSEPEVNVIDGFRAIKTANKILEKVNKRVIL